MADSDKDIVITPNRGQAAVPAISFVGFDNVTCTLSVNNNGTLTVNRQFISSVATGTAPFAVSSTTRVANMNVATAGTADTWTIARTLTIGSSGKSVNGSANVAWSLAELGAAAVNQTMHIGTTAVTINRASGALALTGVSIDGNAGTATALQTARTIGGVSFNGTANINLPGVNIAGNQNTTGNAATATALQTARTIGGVSFNGTANINLPGVNIAGNQNTTGSAATLTTARTLTIGNTGKTFNGSANVAWSSAEIVNRTIAPANTFASWGTGVQIANPDYPVGTGSIVASFVLNSNRGLQLATSSFSENTPLQFRRIHTDQPDGLGAFQELVDNTSTQTVGGVKTFSSTITGSISGNAATATRLQTARTIGGVSFNGTANINLPGVNTAGNQNTTGSAATLTTARLIGGVSFNGSANINLPGVNTAGNQNTTGNAATATNSTQLGGHVRNSDAATANTVAGRNGSGDIFARLIRQTFGNQTTISGGLVFRVNNSTDNFLRVCSDTQAIRTFLNVPTRTGGDASGTWGINITGNSTTATRLQTARTINGVSFNGTAAITLPTVNTAGNQTIGGTKTFSGSVRTRVSAGTFVTSGDRSISVMGNTTEPAVMTFHRAGAYAIQFGLDTDNHLKLGGWSASVVRHTWQNNGNYIASGEITAFSDITLKDNIAAITNPLAKLLSTRGVTFTRIDQEDTDRIHMGVIAQEIEQHFPEIVHTGNDGIKSVNYGAMAGAFIEAIKEQQTQISQQNLRIDLLEQLVTTMTKRD